MVSNNKTNTKDENNESTWKTLSESHDPIHQEVAHLIDVLDDVVAEDENLELCREIAENIGKMMLLEVCPSCKKKAHKITRSGQEYICHNCGLCEPTKDVLGRALKPSD